MAVPCIEIDKSIQKATDPACNVMQRLLTLGPAATAAARRKARLPCFPFCIAYDMQGARAYAAACGALHRYYVVYCIY